MTNETQTIEQLWIVSASLEELYAVILRLELAIMELIRTGLGKNFDCYGNISDKKKTKVIE